jgi:serine/threonine-protein kinase
MPVAKSDALRALELDDTVADAHLSLAQVRHWYEWDWAGAEREYQRAIELNPGDPECVAMYAQLLSHVRRFDESIAMARQAVQLDPVSTERHRMLAQVLYFARRYDDVIEQCHRTLELNPHYWLAYFFLALAQAYAGQFEEALKAVDRMRSLAPGEPYCEGLAGSMLARAGKRDEAARIAADLIERRSGTYFPAMPISWIYNGLGETDQVFKWLDIAHEERDSLLCTLNVTPTFDRLRSDPRFTALLQKMNLEP